MKGRRVDIAATASFYKAYFTVPKPPRRVNKTAFRRKAVLDFVKFFNNQQKSGRVMVKNKTKAFADFAARFGSKAPKGAKIAFVPKKFAGKRVTFKDGVPRIWSKSTVSTVHFLDFFTPEWLGELDDMVEGETDPADLYDFIENEVGKFTRRLPKKAIFSVTLATGDFAKGSTFDKEKLKQFLADLLLRFVKSKGVAQLSDFAVAVNSIESRK